MLILYQAFVSYLRSIHVHKDKSVFKLEELPVERFAESLGLPGAPKIKFLSKEIAKKKKNASHTTAQVQPSARTNVVNSEESEAEEDDLSEHSSSEEEEIQTAESKPEKVEQ